MKRTAILAIAFPLFLALVGGALPEGRCAESPSTERRSRVPTVLYISTPHDVVEEMLKLAEVKKDDVVYDLGCGDGRIVVAAAKQFGCRAVGIDIDPLRIEQAQQLVRENHLEHLVEIKQANMFNVPLDDATVVMLYLSTKYNTRLVPQLNQTKPGSRIVSHLFGIQGVKPEKTTRVQSKEDPHEHTLLLWKTPVRTPANR